VIFLGSIYLTNKKNVWCPGCGNFAILNALIKALERLNLKPESVVLVSGIGCHGRINQYVNVNSIHVIHGRVLPVATGIKISNNRLTVIGHAGDGDAYAIGLGHLPHAARRNVDLTYIIHNNMIFGLTTGQVTPTTPKGMRTRSTPYGNIENPLNPLLLALVSGATFVARGFAGDIKHLIYLFEEGIKHKGFAFIDVLQPCVTFYNTYSYFRERVYRLEETDYDYTSFKKAITKATEWGERIPIGIFYKIRRETFEEQLFQLKDKPLVQQEIRINLEKVYKILS